MIRARLLAICCGYEDCNDFDRLRSDPAFKLACGRLPDSGADLCSQPTLSRLENAPSLRDAIGLTYAFIDQWMASYPTPPASVTLDIDDTCDVVHGRQQLCLFNAYYDEYCFLPIHIYDAATGRPVATNIEKVAPRVLYQTLYCARGQAENLIKAHKTHLTSDRTSCRRAVANQVRIVFHTAAYWLMQTLREAIPNLGDLARAAFTTLRLRLLKLAVRVKETATRIRLAFAAGCPEADLFVGLVATFPPRPKAAAP